MKLPRIILTVAGMVLIPATGSADRKTNIVTQQGELEQLKEQIDSNQQMLDSLRTEEARFLRMVTDYDQRISSDRKVISRLGAELRQLQKQIADVGDQLADRRDLLDQNQRRYLGSIRQFYLASSNRAVLPVGGPDLEMEIQRQVKYLSSLAAFESSLITQAETLLSQSQEELGELAGRSKTVTSLKKQRETSVALGSSQRGKQQRNLDQLRRKSREESDKLVTLQKAAEEMEALIARLQREQLKTSGRRAEGVPSAFAQYQGQLPPPYRGKIVTKFGAAVDPVTKLRTFSPGITIKGRAGGSVRAVSAGTVVYAGELRGYGNFVIIDHDGYYYTTYAGLGTIRVSKGQYLAAKESVGTASEDGLVKFELRKGTDPLDPVKWIRIDAL
ncbi:MAG: peptidoglycan DD-metalloendopeptidase family protein [Candidatus Zixiibacteriota bacterium]|nr:MAG: peptidoglycan DD-metalloendopeptidase family protein [candidate division Zixibacteria bacterium]